MRPRPFITWKRNAEPVANGRRDKIEIAPASRAKEIVPRDLRGAGDANSGENQIGGVSQAAGG
jgi:hypothetical protein